MHCNVYYMQCDGTRFVHLLSMTSWSPMQADIFFNSTFFVTFYPNQTKSFYWVFLKQQNNKQSLITNLPRFK